MRRSIHPRPLTGLLLLGTALALAACASNDDPDLPTLSAATPGTLQSCTDLATKATSANTTIASSTLVAAGALTVTGVTTPMPEHCLVKGEMNRRTSAVDGKSYAIGFEMRLPTAWNGRYFYQANGGIDGSVVTATGPTSGGAPVSNALQMGFAVLSSDAGHSGPPWWGLDPQARLDYGYQAVGSLTPMAKNLIKVAYGKAPDRSYFGGCSNGGRHAMIAAARYSDQYDGILAGAPGFHLPKAATAQLWKVQQYASIASGTVTTGADAGQPDITTAVTPAEFKLLGERIVAKCDALDGASDGIVADIKACQGAFNIKTDVATCSGALERTSVAPRESKRRLRATGSVTALASGSAKDLGPMPSCGLPSGKARRMVCAPAKSWPRLPVPPAISGASRPWPKLVAALHDGSAILNSCRPVRFTLR